MTTGSTSSMAARAGRLWAPSAAAPSAPPSRAYSAGPVCKRRPADRDEGPERDERAREQGRRRLDAREGTHAARASSGVWRGVSSATKLQRMRVTIEYCVV